MRSIVASILLLFCGGSLFAEKVTVWIGTTTPRNGESKGIYHVTLDQERGSLSRPVLAAEISSPGFLQYVVESDEPDGEAPDADLSHPGFHFLRSSLGLRSGMERCGRRWASKGIVPVDAPL